MKYSILFSSALLSGLGGAAQAQEASAPVLADVNQALVLTSTGQTNFGKIDNFAHTEVINPAAPAGSQETAMFVLSSGGGGIVVTCPAEVTLAEPTSSAVMTFTPQLNGSGLNSDPAGSTPLPPCPLNTSSGQNAFQFWFWLGGSLKVGTGQVPGSYRGVYTLSAAYQ